MFYLILKMKKYLVIDFPGNVSFICNTENEVIESMGYEVGEVDFIELLEQVKLEYQVIEIEGEVRWLN